MQAERSKVVAGYSCTLEVDTVGAVRDRAAVARGVEQRGSGLLAGYAHGRGTRKERKEV